MLSKDDINHIANLSRIHITEKEKEKMAGDLSGVLEYVSQLQEAESEVSEEELLESDVYNVLRDDPSTALGDTQELGGYG